MKNSKLVEYIDEIKKDLSKGLNSEFLTIPFVMAQLKLNPDILKQFDEFKNVKRINFVELPIFSADINTEEPINLDGTYLGGPTKEIFVQNLVFGNRVDLLNEVVDIYSIDTIDSYDSEANKNLTFGVWQHPIKYNPINFSSYSKIEVIYSLENIVGEKEISKDEAKKLAKQIILKQVSDLIDSEEVNVFRPKSILLRCSPRSIKK